MMKAKDSASKQQIGHAAAQLDIYDMAYELGTEAFRWGSTEPANYPRKGIAMRLVSFLYRALRALGDRGRRTNATIPSSAVVFLAISQNERHSLDPVVRELNEGYLVGSGYAAKNDFPFVKAYLISIRYLPRVVLAMFKATGFQRRSFQYNFDGYLRSYGLYVAARDWLERLRPRALVAGNHLNVVHRTICKAARDERVPTIYLQHATMPDHVPRLDFTYALLEGRDVLEKYSTAGRSDTIVYLVGMPKFDAYASYPQNQRPVKTVGVCTNNLDSIGRVEELCASLRSELPSLRLILRPHPADSRRLAEWRRISTAHSIELSDWSSEHPFDFLRKVEIMIAGDSNMHLEAALMNVLPIYYDFSGASEDWYGFRRNDLVDFARDLSDVVSLIRREEVRRTPVRSRAKRYCVTVDTAHDGKSAGLAASLIKAFTTPGGNAPNAAEWRLIPNLPLIAYEPV